MVTGVVGYPRPQLPNDPLLLFSGPPHSFLVHGLLKPTHLVQYPHEAKSEWGETVLHLDGRLLAVYTALHYAVASELAQPLVQHLRRQSLARPKELTRPAISLCAKLQQTNGPLAPDNVLHHRGNGKDRCTGRGRVILIRCLACGGCRIVVRDHLVTNLPESAFLTANRNSHRI